MKSKSLNLQGKVKYIKELSYTLIENIYNFKKGGPIGDFFQIDYELSFNNEGRVTKGALLNNGNSEHAMESDFIYNKKGNLKEVINYIPCFKWYNTIKLQHNIQGNIVKKIQTKIIPPHLSYVYRYPFDENGNIFPLNSYESLHLPGYFIKYKYNENNLIEEEIRYTEKWGVVVIYNYSYKNGNRIETKEQHYDRKLSSTIHYQYDEYNNIIQEDHFFHFSLNYRRKTLKYFNDNRGNWVACVIKINDKIRLIAEREIHYYE